MQKAGGVFEPVAQRSSAEGAVSSQHTERPAFGLQIAVQRRAAILGHDVYDTRNCV